MLTESRKLYKVPASEITKYPVLAIAYRKGEFEQNGIPADIIEIKDPEDSRFLILDKGIYDIIIKDRKYKAIRRFEKTVK